MGDRITFKVPKSVSKRFKEFARSKGRTQNSILKEWIKHPDIPQLPFPFSRRIDLSDYVQESWVSKTLRIKPSIYDKFTQHCTERELDMKDVLLSWMLRIMEKAESRKDANDT